MSGGYIIRIRLMVIGMLVDLIVILCRVFGRLVKIVLSVMFKVMVVKI